MHPKVLEGHRPAGPLLISFKAFQIWPPFLVLKFSCHIQMVSSNHSTRLHAVWLGYGGLAFPAAIGFHLLCVVTAVPLLGSCCR